MLPARYRRWPWLLPIAFFALTACHTVPAPAPRQTQLGWRPIGTWTGHGNSQTEPFDIESGQWRIKWETTHEQPAEEGTFNVSVHSTVSGRPLGETVERHGANRGIAYVTEDPRQFYLVIESGGLDWTATVEEGVAAH